MTAMRWPLMTARYGAKACAAFAPIPTIG